MPRKSKSQSPFAKAARKCRGARGPFWPCVSRTMRGGRKARKSACPQGRFKRGPRKGRCRPASAAGYRRRVIRRGD